MLGAFLAFFDLGSSGVNSAWGGGGGGGRAEAVADTDFLFLARPPPPDLVGGDGSLCPTELPPPSDGGSGGGRSMRRVARGSEEAEFWRSWDGDLGDEGRLRLWLRL